jgi:hypothetical protein
MLDGLEMVSLLLLLLLLLLDTARVQRCRVLWCSSGLLALWCPELKKPVDLTVSVFRLRILAHKFSMPRSCELPVAHLQINFLTSVNFMNHFGMSGSIIMGSSLLFPCCSYCAISVSFLFCQHFTVTVISKN